MKRTPRHTLADRGMKGGGGGKKKGKKRENGGRTLDIWSRIRGGPGSGGRDVRRVIICRKNETGEKFSGRKGG